MLAVTESTEAPGRRHEVAIDIGGTPILLRSDDAAFRALLESRYAGFVDHSARAGFEFDVEIIPPGRQLSETDDVTVRAQNGRWLLERGDFRVQLDPEARQGTILQALSPYTIDSALRILHTLIQAEEGGFLLHGASAIRNGKAFLFSGVSEAGKTTISRLAPPDATLLTDEISYVRRDGEGFRAYGTPFAGELARLGANANAQIDRLFFLAKGPENRIEPIEKADALRMLLRNILFFTDDSELVEMVFRSAYEFLARVPVFRLRFYPDERVWDLIQ